MNVREYWTVLREDKWLVGSVLVLCVAIAAAVALLLPRTYTSTAIFYVASPQSAASSTDSYAGSQLSTERVKSYSELLTGPRVAADASSLLGGTPSAADIQKAISADSVAETVVLNLGVTEPTPQDAQLVGTAVATSFTRLVNSIESTGQPVNRPIVSTELIFPPTLPTFSAGPGTTMLLAAGLLAGIVLGVGAALGRRAMRRAVDTPDVLEAALEAPVLTALPGLPRRPDRPALLLEPSPGRRGRRAARARDRAAAVRRLRTAVLAGAAGRRCLVVSGVRAEQGTTTVAVDLAVALALAGESVLLVDADLRRPALAGRLDLDGGRGLATVLNGAGWDGAVQRWSTGGLDVLAAGPGVDRPGEAWGTAAASSALTSLRESYTWVLLDASPVASSPESVDLARLADGVVLVARRGSARPEDLDAAAAGLRTVGTPVIGSVFTFAVDVPTAPVEAPRALPPGRSTVVEPAEAPAAEVGPAATNAAAGGADATVGDATASADDTDEATTASTPAVTAAAEPSAASGPAASGPAASGSAAVEPSVAAAAGAAVAAAPRSRSVRQNAADLTHSAAQEPISDAGQARQNGASAPGTAQAAPSSDTDAPTTAPKRRTRKSEEHAADTANVPTADAAAKPAARTRKTRAAQTPADPTPAAETVTPASGDTAASAPTGKATSAEKPARKPRATRRTAVTTPAETAPSPEPATTPEPTTSPEPATTTGPGTTPAASTGATSTPETTTPPAAHTPNGVPTTGTSTNGNTPYGTTPQSAATDAPADPAAGDPAAADPATTDPVASDDTTAADPSSGTVPPKATRTRRATRTTSRTAAPTDATTTVEGTDKPAARTRATRTRTTTNGHTPRPEASETGTRPTRTRTAPRTTPTSTPTSGS
ncbi:Wzz/FepE/Etk N-terminal domain-containing protein [Actinomycetospora sp.]|uniref:Wzz/FepE/Etk N-terminal domain-containing protein n=1 Tax=Actinomycetospora sp. TaxID=1872135 RepID=UPI002F42FDCD